MGMDLEAHADDVIARASAAIRARLPLEHVDGILSELKTPERSMKVVRKAIRARGLNLATGDCVGASALGSSLKRNKKKRMPLDVVKAFPFAKMCLVSARRRSPKKLKAPSLDAATAP